MDYYYYYYYYYYYFIGVGVELLSYVKRFFCSNEFA